MDKQKEEQNGKRRRGGMINLKKCWYSLRAAV